jgi:hypothetical protein
MAIRQNIQMCIEGVLWWAFLDYCERKGAGTSSEGIRALIRETPEYQKKEKELIPKQENQNSQNGIAANT